MAMNPFVPLQLYKHRRTVWLTTSKLKELQIKKLKQIIKHAYENVSYYRQLFDSTGIKPDDIKTIEDLSKIPVTSKLQLRILPQDEIIAKNVNINECIKLTISGQVGIPLDIFFTRKDAGFLNMLWARSFLENGLRFRDKRVSIEYSFPPKSWLRYLGIWRREYLSVINDPEHQANILQKMRPDVLTGNSFDIDMLARVVKVKSIGGINPRLVFSIGSFLSQSSWDLISSVFKTEVFNYYGTAELGCVGWECTQHNGYHINIDAFVVEIIKDGKPVPIGERGEIICTALHSYAMPFIRYRTGDIAALTNEQCPCGRGLPLMSSVEGRANDFITGHDGRLVSPCLITSVLKVIPGIAHYRVVQESKELLTIKIVKARDFSNYTAQRVRSELEEILGKEMHIDIQLVDEIPEDPPGKIRSMVSKIPTRS
jgi:phenylacetate-CoA ligase